jgi:hypothetical protein
MIRSIISSAVAGLAGYAATTAVLKSRLRTRPDVVRTNHAGRDVSLIEGPAVTAGLLAGGLLIEDPRQRVATLLATGAAGSLGAVDDFLESGSSKGLRGHLSALARGEITTGALKITGIPLASIAAAAILRTGTRRTGLFAVSRQDDSNWVSRACDVIVTGGVIAGSANLFNLLDLRPGRALKTGALTLAFTDHHRTRFMGAERSNRRRQRPPPGPMTSPVMSCSVIPEPTPWARRSARDPRRNRDPGTATHHPRSLSPDSPWPARRCPSPPSSNQHRD